MFSADETADVGVDEATPVTFSRMAVEHSTAVEDDDGVGAAGCLDLEGRTPVAEREPDDLILVAGRYVAEPARGVQT
jgi:hypothetical protein